MPMVCRKPPEASMRIPTSMSTHVVPTKMEGGITVHAKPVGRSEALCGRTITNWLDSPGQSEWYVYPDDTELTCPCCIKFCVPKVEITPNDAVLIFSLAGFAEGENQLRVEDLTLLRKLRDVYPGIWKQYDYIDLGDSV